ncbi:MAG: outer membrane lipoprotein-sorting protein [Flavobacteriaceae bacterium]|nr:outer membrane lipoprotein-sorting protein [Flavobacteriaceae bacterium]
MKTIVIFTITIVIALIGTAFMPLKTGLEIVQEAEKADNGWASSSNTLTMTLTNRNGQKTTRKMHGYTMEVEGDGDMSMTIFDTPKDVKGTASMIYTHKIGDDDQWLYLPAIKRVKRISSSNKSGPFMGSEFAYEDLSSQEVEKYTYKFILEEKINGQDSYKIERYPVSKSSGYKRNIVWLNKANYRVEKIEYYDRKDALLKTLSFSNYKQYLSKYWRANTLKMVNHQNVKETLLVFSDRAFGVNLTKANFSQNALKRAR